MIIITVIMFLAALFGGIPTVAKSPECLIISRALVGLHCGKLKEKLFFRPSKILHGFPVSSYENKRRVDYIKIFSYYIIII